MTFKLQNIERVNFEGSGTGVSMIHTSGGVSVGGFINATEGVSAGTLQLNSGSITDTTGVISFGSANLSNTNGVSFSGGVSLNGYTYPTSLGTSQFLYHKRDGTGVSGYGLSGGNNVTLTYGENFVTIASTGGGGSGGTSVGASSGILITEGTSVSVNVGAGLEFGDASGGTSTVQLNLYSSGNLQFYPGTGGVGSSVGLCSSIIVPTSVTVGPPPSDFGANDDSVKITGGDGTGGVIDLYDSSGIGNVTIKLEAESGGNTGVITLTNGTGTDITLTAVDVTGAIPGNVIRMADSTTFGDSIKLMSHGGTHDQSEINLYESTGTSTVKIYGETATGGAGLIELFGSGGNTPGTPTVTLGGTSGRLTLNDGTTGVSVTIGLSSSATENTNFILPGVSPAADGYVLSSDTVGNLSWVPNGSGGSGVSSLNDLNDAKVVNNSLILGNEGQTASPLTGPNNVAVGVSALFAETTGTNNVAIGYNAMESSQTGNDNIAIGMSTLNLYTGTGGGFNTVVGSNSGSGITSSGVSGLTIIGASSGVGLTGASSNLTLIGYQVEPTIGDTSDSVYIGNNAVNKVYIKGSVLVTSDGRDKTDVEDSAYGLNIVDNLRPVEFTWDRRPIVPGDAENTTNGQRTVGLIAQEVRDSLTEEENKILNLVNDSSEERFHMCYNNLIPILVKAGRSGYSQTKNG